MSWTDRLLPATYISPSGIPFNFQYEDVSMESDRKTATFVFPEVDGAFIQDLGRAGRRFPFTIFFSGDDYDILSDSFMAALEEKGIGTLIHPKYGTKFVIPTGSISRNDNLLSSANQAVFNVTFSETIIGSEFPSLIENVLSKIKTALSVFSTITSIQFKDNVVAGLASEIISIKNKLINFVLRLGLQLNPVIKISEEVYAAYQVIDSSIQDSINQVSDYPDIAMIQLIQLVRLPSESPNEIETKYNSYNNIINNILSNNYKLSISSNEPQNNFLSDFCFVYSNLAAICESCINQDFNTRNEVILYHDKIIESFDNIKTWLDNNITSLNYIDSGESYDAILNIISLTSAYLINLAFELPSEKKIILGEDRNIIELVSELYQDLEKIDYFITTNELTADEIEILPRGKEVVFYV
jgi:hypothetical protein